MKRTLIAACLMFAGGAVPAEEVVDELADKTPKGGTDRPMDTGTRISLNAVQEAFDQAPPNGSVMTVRYDRNVTYKLRIREMMQSLIALPAGETIKDYVLGDKFNFSFDPLPDRQRARIGGKYPGADTNLIVVSDTGKVYSFYVRIDSVKSPYLPTLVLYIEDGRGPALPVAAVLAAAKDEKPAAEVTKATDKAPMEAAKADDGEYLRSLKLADVASLNFLYDTSGDNSLAPLRIFDDGHWTYFQYGNGNLDGVQQLPTVYKVVEGFDTPVNTRVVAGTLVAEAVGGGWTLRSGSQHLCVRKK
jgi:ComB9 competence protein